MQKIRDLTGQRFGRLVAKYPTDKRLCSSVVWHCECDCGKSCDVATVNLRNGSTKSCGCLHREAAKKQIGKNRNPKFKDISGQVFGELTALYPVLDAKRGKRMSMVWHCKCSCGKEVDASCQCLVRGYTVSCGHVRLQNTKDLVVDGTAPCRIPPSLRKTNTSGCTGVHFDKRSQRWIAKIVFKQRSYYLGAYKELKDAAMARKQAEDNLYGPFLEWYAETYPEHWEKLQGRREEKIKAQTPKKTSDSASKSN